MNPLTDHCGVHPIRLENTTIVSHSTSSQPGANTTATLAKISPHQLLIVATTRFITPFASGI